MVVVDEGKELRENARAAVKSFAHDGNGAFSRPSMTLGVNPC